MGLLADINDLCTAMLKQIIYVNTYIGFGAGGLQPADADIVRFEEVRDESGLKLVSRSVSDGRVFSLKNWHSHSICLIGLSFGGDAHVSNTSLRRGQVSFSATTEHGVGARYLFAALGSRHIVVNFNTHADANDDDLLWENASLIGLEVKLYSEGEAELRALHDAIILQKGKLDKAWTVSTLSNNLQNFGKLTGIDEIDFYKSSLPNSTFDNLFEDVNKG